MKMLSDGMRPYWCAICGNWFNRSIMQRRHGQWVCKICIDAGLVDIKVAQGLSSKSPDP